MYATGDVGRWLVDGNLEFAGRRDHQVKIRGFRVELEEIEEVILEHDGVRAAAVLAREDERGEKRLVAYVAGKKIPPATELRRHLREKLPEYMIPASYVVMPQMPLTPQGKIDRRALPEPEGFYQPVATSIYVAPRNETEQRLGEIWEQVLRVARVGIDDNFFELGGHSLLATQVVSRIRESFVMELPLRSLFERPTIAGIAEEIEKARDNSAQPRVPAIEAMSREAHRVKRTALDENAMEI
jgi:acyl carrier protein